MPFAVVQPSEPHQDVRRLHPFFPEARSDELVDIGKRMICFKCIHKEGMFDPIFKTVFRILFLSPTS